MLQWDAKEQTVSFMNELVQMESGATPVISE